MADSGAQQWLGQEDLAWNILLVARLRARPSTTALQGRLAEMSVRHGWAEPGPGSVLSGELADLLPRLGEVSDLQRPVSLGVTPGALVVRAHHARVDGLGLLAVLRDVAAGDLTSGASGVGERSRRSTVATMAGRLLEVLLRPPAGVAAVGAAGPIAPGDVFAARTLPTEVRTASLADAAVRAIVERNTADGQGTRRIALAVGVSTISGHDLRVGDDSGFLRITGAEELDTEGLSRAFAEAPLQVGGTAQGAVAQRAGGLIRWTSKTFARRLGSTLLVSHLGRVQADGVDEVAFYPLAGGGSGLALGAATVGSSTTITLRARGAQHSRADLELLLDAVVDALA
jgi:hypothetical protein